MLKKEKTYIFTDLDMQQDVLKNNNREKQQDVNFNILTFEF